jgi:ribonuclease HI
MSGRIRVHGDGGSRGNPGPAAAAAVLLTASGEIIEKRSEFMGVATNNQAEYLAVELGLRALHELGHTEADFFLDSQLVVRQLNGQYKVKHPDMKLAFDRIQKLKKDLDVTFTHVLRADNTIADTVVNECLDAHL